jgi:hypothetical protein
MGTLCSMGAKFAMKVKQAHLRSLVPDLLNGGKV